MYDSKPLHPSRSIDDLLSPSMSSMRAKNSLRNSTYFSPLINNGFPSDSDFVDFNRQMDAFHDFPDTHHNFPTNRPHPFDQSQPYCRPSFVHANEQRLPNDYQQANSTQQSSSKSKSDFVRYIQHIWGSITRIILQISRHDCDISLSLVEIYSLERLDKYCCYTLIISTSAITVR